MFRDEDIQFGEEPPMGDEMPPMGDEMPPMGGEMPQEPKENIFGESRVENVLKGYFRVTEDELPVLEEKRQKDYIKSKLTKLKAKKELEELTETRYQLETANRLLNEGAQFVGKTNLSNLIFNRRGQQIKIDRKGNVI